MGEPALPPSRDALLAVGAFGKPHGIRGEITFRPFGSWPADVAAHPNKGLPIWLEQGNRLQAMCVETCRRAGDHWIFRLRAVAGREDAAKLTSAVVHVSRADLPPLEEGEFYVADLPGLETRNDRGEVLGRVKATFWNGAHDVAVVDGPRGEMLIPLVPAVVQRVDARAGTLEVVWDEEADEDVGADGGGGSPREAPRR